MLAWLCGLRVHTFRLLIGDPAGDWEGCCGGGMEACALAGRENGRGMSEIAEQFHARISAEVAAEHRESLRLPASGVSRELRRGLHLSDRAVRQWAAHAAEHGQPEHRSAYGRLPPLRPELGHDAQEAADAEQRSAPDAERELIAQLVWGVGERLSGIDANAPPLSTQPSLNRIATEAAEILLAAGRVLGDQSWVIDEANEAVDPVARPTCRRPRPCDVPRHHSIRADRRTPPEPDRWASDHGGYGCRDDRWDTGRGSSVSH
jgi:hypothetical protein